MDGRGGLFVEVAGGVEGFKHQIICVLLRMISEVLNICDRVMKGMTWELRFSINELRNFWTDLSGSKYSLSLENAYKPQQHDCEDRKTKAGKRNTPKSSRDPAGGPCIALCHEGIKKRQVAH